MERFDLTTKIHAIVDAMGLSVEWVYSEGQAYEGHYAHELLEHQQPHTMPQCRIKTTFSRVLYRACSPVERFINKLKHFRVVTT